MDNALAVIPPSQIEIAERTFALVQRKAIALSGSSLVPKEYAGNVPNCVIAIEMSERMGVNVLMVVQNLNIIHNRPSWSSTFIIAAINSCGRFRPLRFDFTGTEGQDDWACVAWTVERDVEIPKNIRTLKQAEEASLPVLKSPQVSIGMAKAEGWYGKAGSKWKTIPGLMLCYRPAAFFGRIYASDVLMGMQSSDEIEDMGMIDVTPPSPDTIVVPKDKLDAFAKDDAVNKADTVDAETGEIIEGAGNSSPPEVKPTDPKPAAAPAFDINRHNINTAAGTKAAAAEFIGILGAHPQEERGSIFLQSSGMMLVDAMRTHGLALDVKKIEALGVGLPPSTDSAATRQPSSPRKLFQAKELDEGEAV